MSINEIPQNTTDDVEFRQSTTIYDIFSLGSWGLSISGDALFGFSLPRRSSCRKSKLPILPPVGI